MRELKFRMLTQTTDKILGYVDIYDLLRKGSDVLSDLVEAMLGGVKFEQYTGLKDKNGKEIYEGDICRLAYYTKKDGKKRWHKDYEDVEEAEFEDGYFKFSNTDQYGIGSELSFSDYGEWSTADGSYKYEAEVIGNIHENKELLGGD